MSELMRSPLIQNAVRLWRERRQEIRTICFFVLIALASYALGYTMAQDSARTPIIIEHNRGASGE